MNSPIIEQDNKVVDLRNDMEIIFQAINEQSDDEIVFNILSMLYGEILAKTNQIGLDSFFLEVSRLLEEQGLAREELDKKQTYRASKIAKRLAHFLYRQYKRQDRLYSKNDFIQNIGD